MLSLVYHKETARLALVTYNAVVSAKEIETVLPVRVEIQLQREHGVLCTRQAVGAVVQHIVLLAVDVEHGTVALNLKDFPDNLVEFIVGIAEFKPFKEAGKQRSLAGKEHFVLQIRIDGHAELFQHKENRNDEHGGSHPSEERRICLVLYYRRYDTYRQANNQRNDEKICSQRNYTVFRFIHY